MDLTKEQLVKELKEMGIKPTDTVKLHISMKALGMVIGGADAIIDAFKEVVCDGLLVIPTHTWDVVPLIKRVYDVRNSMPCVGVLPMTAAFRPDGVRSLHPSHSVVAFGKDAEEFVKGEELSTSPASPNGISKKMLDRNAKIVLVGVGQERNTILHGFDEMLDLPRLNSIAREVKIIGRNGEEYTTNLHAHAYPISCHFPKFEPAFVKYGAQKNYKFGNTVARVCEAKRLYEVYAAINKQTDENLCCDDLPLLSKYYENLDI